MFFCAVYRVFQRFLFVFQGFLGFSMAFSEFVSLLLAYFSTDLDLFNVFLPHYKAFK